jgi:hypothetical protein
MYLTLIHNSGGNHGHQLKEAFGALTIAKLFNFTYAHTPYDYLDWFALGDGEMKRGALGVVKEFRVEPIRRWSGFSLKEAKKLFGRFRGDNLVVLERVQIIHPFQTIKWHQEGLIKRNIFQEIVDETHRKFINRHGKRRMNRVAMHISRGRDYERGKYRMHHTSERYMFPIEYFVRIADQLKDHELHIYTERLNSEEIVKTFKNRAILHIGDNRDDRNYQQIYSIFYDFVMSDIFVGCNSSFSTVVAYFRKGKMIYHPHVHLQNLPTDQYIPTDINGNFNTKLL